MVWLCKCKNLKIIISVLTKKCVFFVKKQSKKSLKNQPEHLKRMQNGPFGPAPPFLMISSVKKTIINGDIHQ